MSDKLFGIGDAAWVGTFHNHHPIREDCPVCFGKKEVTVILGNGDHVLTPCEYCRVGYGDPRGWVTDRYESECSAEVVVITGVELSAEQPPRYRSDCHSYDAVFATREEALAYAERKRDEDVEQKAERKLRFKEREHKSYSWHVGYHMREAIQLRKRAEYHEQRAVVCRGLARPKGGE